MAHQMGPQNKYGIAGSDSMAEVLDEKLAKEIVILKELVNQQQVIIDWIIMVQKFKQAQRSTENETHSGSRWTIRGQMLPTKMANTVENSEVLSKRQFISDNRETMARFEPCCCQSDQLNVGWQEVVIKERSKENSKVFESSVGRYMSKYIYRDCSRKKILKCFQVARKMKFRGATEKALNRKVLKRNSNEKITAAYLSEKTAFSEGAINRLRAQEEDHAALDAASWRKRGLERDGRQEDETLIGDIVCRNVTFCWQFANDFHVSGRNRCDAASSMWMKRETHVSFREGEG